MAAGDLTTLANVKGWLNVTTSTDDALLARLISAYSAYIQTWLNRVIASQSYSEVREGAGGCSMMFADYPVTAVASVTVDGIPIPVALNFTDSGYRFTKDSIILTGYRFTRGHANVQLGYTAGYDVVPPELEQAAIEVIALRFKERDRIGFQSKSLAGETVSFYIKDFPASVQTILNNWKKVVPL